MFNKMPKYETVKENGFIVVELGKVETLYRYVYACIYVLEEQLVD